MQRQKYPAPDPSVLFYKRTRDNGRTEFASMETLEQYEGQSWRGRFLTPGQAPVVLDQYSSELNQWEPVYALTQKDIEGIIERVAQRVTEILGAEKASPAEITEAGMQVVLQKSVPAAIQLATKKTSKKAAKVSCDKCGRLFKSDQGLKVHIARTH